MTPANLLIYKRRHRKNEFNIIYIMRTYAHENGRHRKNTKTLDTVGAMSLYYMQSCVD
jgi:hypothetical protein